jgi:hypothetical protein
VVHADHRDGVVANIGERVAVERRLRERELHVRHTERECVGEVSVGEGSRRAVQRDVVDVVVAIVGEREREHVGVAFV